MEQTEHKYKVYRKKQHIEVVGTFPNGDVIVQNKGDDSDQWKIDKETFERQYVEVKQKNKK
ncbi:hypothetical protein WCX49_06675 [Sulfurimonas sp. HSL-1656]|uniref:hypothetical protein n=1 Tax=Thiomicrolovo subterrani TaxID=3131934 RepID=UPI0031F8E044